MSHRRVSPAAARPPLPGRFVESLESRRLLSATVTMRPVDGLEVEVIDVSTGGTIGGVTFTPTPGGGATTGGSVTERPEAGGSAVLEGGVLTVVGTDGNDEIYVEQRTGGEVHVVMFNTVEGQQVHKRLKFAAADVREVRIDGKSGDDYIATGGVTVNPIYVDAGAGPSTASSVTRSADGERVVSGKTKALRAEGGRVVSGKTKAQRPTGERIVSGRTKALREQPRVVSGRTLAKRAAEMAAKRAADEVPIPEQPGESPKDVWSTLPAVIFGGHGDDHIGGSGANDTIDGGAGDDVIDGRGGDDALAGGNDNDTVLGGLGGDALDGGNGDDVLLGNAY